MAHASWEKITFLMLTKLVRRKAGTQKGRQEERRNKRDMDYRINITYFFKKNIILIHYVIFYHNITHLIKYSIFGHMIFIFIKSSAINIARASLTVELG